MKVRHDKAAVNVNDLFLNMHTSILKQKQMGLE